MSGRVRVKLADGRRVTGFRKTLRRNPRTPADQMPDWRVKVQLRGSLALVTPGMATGVVGVTVTDGPAIEARGRDWDWVLRQVAEFIGKIAKGFSGRLTAVIERDAYPGPTESGPLRPAIKRTGEFIVTDRASVVIPRPLRDPLIYPVRP